MPKAIKPFELAQIVATLLANPQVLGELDSGSTYGDFVEEIGRVVGEYCGGDVKIIDRATAPKLAVWQNDALPSVHHNVWSTFDPSGRLEHPFGQVDPDDAPMSEADMINRRQAMHAELISLAAKVQQG